MAKRTTTFLAVCAIAAGLMGSCGPAENEADGGFEAGNPPAPTTTRSLKGEVGHRENGAEVRYAFASASENCIADTVVAASSEEEETNAEIGEDCRFSIDLTVGTAYEVHFELGGEFVGALSFSNDENGLDATTLVVGAGETEIDIGVVSFTDGLAIPETSPATQNDQDGDGVTDAEDGDDDGNGLDDLTEADCDLDGVPDAVDSVLSGCEAADADDDGGDDAANDPESPDAGDENGGAEDPAIDPVSVLEVLPRHNAGIDALIQAPGLSTTVSARADCVIDPASVTADTLQVSGGIACDFSVTGGGAILNCAHTADPFLTLTIYTATLDGVTCEDGTPVETRSWTWMALGVSLGGL